MVDHPFVGDLSSKTMDELSEKINSLAGTMSWAFRVGKHDMVKQMQQVLTTYRAEYQARQAEMWAKNSGNADNKINIS